MCRFLGEGWALVNGALSTSIGTTQGVTALTAAYAAHNPLPASLERRGVAHPVGRGRFQPHDDLLRGVRILPRQRPAHGNPLNRLAHVQHDPLSGVLQRHDAVGCQPQHEVGRLMSRQIIQDQHIRKRGSLSGNVK